ncbi:Galactose-3-O-sulfotransferase [Trinorchestia longiramus]|nr:Galactose-3-O-sulfotransferase [Trinorchestia longiramus]
MMNCWSAPGSLKLRVLFWVMMPCIVIVSYFSSQYVRDFTIDLGAYGSRPKPPPHEHIMFLKTHKCASSALQNMFLRYAYKHKLSVALPQIHNYLGNPQLFQRHLIPSNLLPKSGKVDVFAVHTRLNPLEHMEVLHPDTVFVTAVREPVSLFESLYNFFNFQNFNGLSLTEFLNLPFEKQANMVRIGGKLGPNMMLFDMGHDVYWNTTDDEIKAIISEVDRLFNIVLIAEKLDESIILLENLLHWDYSDMILYEKNARQKEFIQQLPSEQQMQIRKLCKGDQMLYDYFLERHEKAVEAFGVDRMAKEVVLLQSKRNEMFELCGMKRKQFLAPEEEIFKEYSHLVENLVIDDLTDENCLLLSLPELKLLDKMRDYQNELLAMQEKKSS